MERAIDTEALLRHVGWMQSLARSLLRDDSLAEDAVQETFLAAFRSPPRHRGALGAWLRTSLLRSVSRARVQEDRRRRREERAARDERIPREPGDDIERLEVQRLLIEEVIRLEEPCRSTVVLRFFDGLTVAEIARRHGVDESTARYRLKTALDRLRSSIAARTGGGGAWRASLAPLLSRPDPPVEPASEAAASGIAEHAITGVCRAYTLMGVVALKQKSALVAGVLSLVLAGLIVHGSRSLWTAAPRPGGAAARPTLSVAREETPAETAPGITPPRAAEVAPGAPEPAVVTKPAGGVLRGRVTSADTEAPLPGAVVLVRGSGNETFADENGEYELEGLALSDLFVVARAEDHAEQHARLRVSEASSFRQDFRLDPALDLHVTVRDPDGRPLEGVEVTPAQPNRDYVHDEVYTRRTGPDGAALLTGINRNDLPQVNARKAGYSEVWTRDYTVAEEASTADLRIVLEPRPLLERTITGTVTGPGRKPLEGIHVQWIHAHGENEGREVTASGRDGRYTLLFSSDKQRVTLSAYGEGWAPAIRENIDIASRTEPAVVDFELEPGHWLEGTVRDEEGNPVDGAVVDVMPTLGALRNITLYPGNLRTVSTDPAGRFRIADLSGPTVALQLRGPGGSGVWAHNMNEVVEVDTEVDLVLERWKVIRGRVRDADTGEPVTAFNVKLGKGRGYYDYKRCDPGESFHSAEGRFLLEKLDPDRFAFTVEASGYITVHFDAVPSSPPESGEEILVEMTRGADLEGIVIDRETASPVAGAVVSYGVPKGRDLAWDRGALESMPNVQRSVTGPDGAFRVVESETGTLFVHARGYARRAVRPADRKASLDASGRLAVALDRGAILRGVLYQDGAPCRTGFLILSREPAPGTGDGQGIREWIGNLDRDEGGAFEAADLAPGEYTLAHYRETPGKITAGLAIHTRIEISAELEARVEFGKDYGSIVYAGRILDGEGKGLDEVHLELEPAFEWGYSRFSAYVKSSHESRFHFEGLRPGTYRVRARGQNGSIIDLPDLDLRSSLEEETVVVRGG